MNSSDAYLNNTYFLKVPTAWVHTVFDKHQYDSSNVYQQYSYLVQGGMFPWFLCSLA